MRIILISGISGSGRTVALNALEDAGFYCMENIPAALIQAAVTHLHEQGLQRLAIALDSRALQGGNEEDANEEDAAAEKLVNAANITELVQDLIKLPADVRSLFLQASDATLAARFSETRRRHPLSTELSNNSASAQRSLEACIALERCLMQPLHDASHVIDTTGLAVSTLRKRVSQFAQATGAGLILTFESFGFKHGVPQDADLMFDVRLLPNPHYEAALRPLTGMDAPVQQFLANIPATAELIEDISRFIETWLPHYERDGRSYLTVAIGCTGGQHRSVYVVEKLAQHFAQKARVVTVHRQQK